MLRFEKLFDFWKISINSTGWVKNVLENSWKRNFFSNVPKYYPESTFHFFWNLTEWWFWHENPQWGKIKNKNCLIEGFHVKIITQSKSKKSQKWILDNFLARLKKMFVFGNFSKLSSLSQWNWFEFFRNQKISQIGPCLGHFLRRLQCFTIGGTPCIFSWALNFKKNHFSLKKT